MVFFPVFAQTLNGAQGAAEVAELDPQSIGVRDFHVLTGLGRDEPEAGLAPAPGRPSPTAAAALSTTVAASITTTPPPGLWLLSDICFSVLLRLVVNWDSLDNGSVVIVRSVVGGNVGQRGRGDFGLTFPPLGAFPLS